MGDRGMSDMRRLGDHLRGSADGVMGELAGRRLARRNTTRKPSRSSTAPTPTPAEVRQKVVETLWWVKQDPAMRAMAPAFAPALTASDGEDAVCPHCGGAGWVRSAAIGAECDWRITAVPCACQAERLARARWERALAASDIAPKLLALDFAGPHGYDATHNPLALQAAQAWCDDASRASLPWLLLYGGPGSGKTHLLAACFNALLAQGRYPLYTLVPALLDHVRAGLDIPNGSQGGEYAARIQAVQQAPILILDDLGAEKVSDWSQEALFKLLDYRYRQELPTAVASNLLPADLEPRIASRLQDRALSVALLMSGPDYRLSGAQSVHTRRKGAR